jgi:hypothetical protein
MCVKNPVLFLCVKIHIHYFYVLKFTICYFYVLKKIMESEDGASAISLAGTTFFLLGPFSMDSQKKASSHLGPFASKTNIHNFIEAHGGVWSTAITSKVDVVFISDCRYHIQGVDHTTLKEFRDYLGEIHTRGPIQKSDDDFSDVVFLSIGWLIDGVCRGKLSARSAYIATNLQNAKHAAVKFYQTRLEMDCAAGESNGTKIEETSYDGLLDGKYKCEDICEGKLSFFNFFSNVTTHNHRASQRDVLVGTLPITDVRAMTNDAIAMLDHDYDYTIKRLKKCNDRVKQVASAKFREFLEQTDDACEDDLFS